MRSPRSASRPSPTRTPRRPAARALRDEPPELRPREPAVVAGREQTSSRREHGHRERDELVVVALGDEPSLLRRRVARRIEDDEIELLRGDAFQRLGAALRIGDVETKLVQVPPQHVANHLVIVDDQNPPGHLILRFAPCPAEIPLRSKWFKHSSILDDSRHLRTGLGNITPQPSHGHLPSVHGRPARLKARACR